MTAPVSRRPAAGSGDVAEWCHRTAGPDVPTITDAARLPSGPLAGVALPGTLERVDDPEHLLETLSERLERRGRLVAAVSWAAPSPVDSRRSFHPASLLGLVSARLEVVELDVASGVLGVVAFPEPDPARRELAALRALQRAQPEIEQHLESAFRSKGQRAALRDALSGAEQAIIEADDAEHESRRQRNVAREKLRGSRSRVDELEADIAAARERVDELATALEAERTRREQLRERLDHIEATRAYRLWARGQTLRQGLAALTGRRS